MEFDARVGVERGFVLRQLQSIEDLDFSKAAKDSSLVGDTIRLASLLIDPNLWEGTSSLDQDGRLQLRAGLPKIAHFLSEHVKSCSNLEDARESLVILCRLIEVPFVAREEADVASPSYRSGSLEEFVNSFTDARVLRGNLTRSFRDALVEVACGQGEAAALHAGRKLLQMQLQFDLEPLWTVKAFKEARTEPVRYLLALMALPVPRGASDPDIQARVRYVLGENGSTLTEYLGGPISFCDRSVSLKACAISLVSGFPEYTDELCSIIEDPNEATNLRELAIASLPSGVDSPVLVGALRTIVASYLSLNLRQKAAERLVAAQSGRVDSHTIEALTQYLVETRGEPRVLGLFTKVIADDEDCRLLEGLIDYNFGQTDAMSVQLLEKNPWLQFFDRDSALRTLELWSVNWNVAKLGDKHVERLMSLMVKFYGLYHNELGERVPSLVGAWLLGSEDRPKLEHMIFSRAFEFEHIGPLLALCTEPSIRKAIVDLSTSQESNASYLMAIASAKQAVEIWQAESHSA